MKKLLLASVVQALVMGTAYADTLYFKDFSGAEPNVTSGNLPVYVSFAQSHTIDPNGNAAKEMPRLVARRAALLMASVVDSGAGFTALTATVMDQNGVVLGELPMNPPAQLPRSDKENLSPKHPNVEYAANTWSVELPWNWIAPGMTVSLHSNDGKTAALDTIEVGAPNDLLLINARFGFFADVPSKVDLEVKPYLVADYFQRMPVSRLVLSNYAPVRLDEIHLSNGTVYHERSADEGSVYEGDLRNEIGRALYSAGTDNANYGVNTSDPTSFWQQNWMNQTHVFKSIGLYSNGYVTHGLSASHGTAAVVDTVDNEFSHELAHSYGLMSHYYGGGKLATHNEDSGWAYNAVKGRFMANFFWNEFGNMESQGHVTPPFKGIYRFNRDTLGGGSASSPLSRYTHHTGHTQKLLQQELEKKSRLTPNGYVKWDEASQSMIPNKDRPEVPEAYGVPVVTLLGFYDPQEILQSYIYPAAFSSYGHTYSQPATVAGSCWADVATDQGVRRYPLSAQYTREGHMNKFHFNVARADNPTQVDIYCPKTDPLAEFAEYRAAQLGTSDFKTWGEPDNYGMVGDVYAYHHDGRVAYYRLKQYHYWYFPDIGTSNDHWEFLTTDDIMINEFQAGKPYDQYGKTLIASRTIGQPEVEPAPAVIIGEEAGYAAIGSSLRTFDQISGELRARAFGSVWDLKQYLKSYYGIDEVKHWSAEGKGKVGDVYHYLNDNSGTQDFFVLMAENYGPYPVDQTSSATWKFLGSADPYINAALNPFDTNLDESVGLKTQLMQAKNKDRMYVWDDRSSCTEEAGLFEYWNPYNYKTEYFVQKRWQHGGYFPTDERSNDDWLYVGSEEQHDSNVARMKAGLASYNQVVAEWYRTDAVRYWSDSNVGVVGDIYMREHLDGKKYYYTLLKEHYGTFPSEPGVSSDVWLYQGKYPF